MLIQATRFSQALSKMTGLVAIIPEGDGPFPAIYQLHGLSDDHTVWTRRTSIERYADEHRVIVVMPDGGRGCYADAGDGCGRHEAHILETIAVADRTFPTRAERAHRAIGGLSMGGYGAVKIGLKHPHLFASIAAHSSVLAPERAEFTRIYPEMRRTFPDGVGAADDCFALARRAARLPAAQRPQLRFDCGSDDFLIQHNRDFHAHLDAIRMPHEYAEFPGAHSWAYWDEHVREAFAFHRRAFDRAARRAQRRA